MIATVGTNNQNSRWPGDSANPQTRFRERIYNELLARDGNRGKGWTVRSETVAGRLLNRFDSLANKRTPIKNDRLVGDGFWMVIWADPKTGLVVRTHQEYYDGKQHYIYDNDHFVYNQSIPDNLFSTTPPPGVKVIK